MSSEGKLNIREFDLDGLKDILTGFGEPTYRAKQIQQWLWINNIREFQSMLNVPKALISKLDARYFIPSLEQIKVQLSSDGTIKSGFKLFDSKIVEGVLIPQTKRMTACISSQVGCSLSCKFCATGMMKQMRNMTADEMYDQVKAIN